MCQLGIKPGLERIKRLLSALGNPQEGLRVVHIAGTNGKGSTALIIARVLQEAGYHTGFYSSPHLYSYCERFEVDACLITADRLYDYLRQVYKAREAWPEDDWPSEFETLTAIALLYFRDEGTDVAVLETGLGGLYDATTIAMPLLSVITTVDFDHMGYLGDSLEEIAANKAGIIKKGVPLVVGTMPEEAWAVIAARAESLQSPLISTGEVKIVAAEPPGLCGQLINICFKDRQLQKVWFSLPGSFQLQNLALALTALRQLKKQQFMIADEYIESALGKLHTKGRLELLYKNPLIICDVAHNRQAAQALEFALGRLLPDEKKVLLCGLVDDKDAGGILQHLGSNSKACIVTRPLGQRSQQWQRVAAEWQRLYPEIPCLKEEDIVGALRLGLSILSEDDYLLLTGSFYVINRARQFLLPYMASCKPCVKGS